MGRGHGDKLSTVDAAFLHMETPTQHMHVGGLFVFDASQTEGFDFGRFLRLVRSRLHHVPRYRQRLAFAPLHLSNPIWVDDGEFDLGYHVRHAALPRPGTTQQLMEYSARILSRPRDRDRP
ncbi:MAG: wax ester/triacylglycerol synthase family O-acyltransferase, partial [Nitriliruptorales bacterium]|nr:wax ester/triacylglycerol synthase family O-acyltransferase [Nitriliruptorales bacterium]